MLTSSNDIHPDNANMVGGKTLGFHYKECPVDQTELQKLHF
jgi:hypothetical protein